MAKINSQEDYHLHLNKRMCENVIINKILSPIIKNMKSTSLLFFALILILSLLITYPAFCNDEIVEPVSTNLKTTGTTGNFKGPDLELGIDNTVYVLYEELVRESINGQPVLTKIWLKRFDTSGQELGNPIVLHESPNLGASNMHIDNGGSLHLLWADGSKCSSMKDSVTYHYRRWNPDLTPATPIIDLSTTCTTSVGYWFQHNDLTTDNDLNAYIRFDSGYFIVNPAGEIIHSQHFDNYRETNFIEIEPAHTEGVHLVWASRSKDKRGFADLFYQHDKVNNSGMVETVTTQQIGSIETFSFGGEIKLTPNKDTLYIQIENKSCWSSSRYRFGSYSIDKPDRSEEGIKNLATLLKLDSHGNIVSTEYMPLCGNLVPDKDNITVHYVPMASHSCSGANMEVFFASTPLGYDPSSFKNVLSVLAVADYHHGPSFWEDAIKYDSEGNIYVSWFLNTGINKYMVHYLKIKPDGTLAHDPVKVAP